MKWAQCIFDIDSLKRSRIEQLVKRSNSVSGQCLLYKDKTTHSQWGPMETSGAVDAARRKTRALPVACHVLEFIWCNAERTEIRHFIFEETLFTKNIERFPFFSGDRTQVGEYLPAGTCGGKKKSEWVTRRRRADNESNFCVNISDMCLMETR